MLHQQLGPVCVKRPPALLQGEKKKEEERNYLPAAALVPAMWPVVKHIWMEVPEAGYSL